MSHAPITVEEMFLTRIESGYGGRIRTYVNEFQRLAPFQLGHSVKILAEATGVEPAHAMRGDLANRCHTIRRRLRELEEGTGVEPASDERGSFRDHCLTS